jgi:hypothetical protein
MASLSLPISRRALLASGVAVGMATVGGSLVHLGGPAPGLKVLTAREARLVEAVAAVFFPPGIFPVHGGDGGTVAGVDTFLADQVDPQAVAPFRYLLRALDMGTLFSRGRPFTSLSADEAEAVLQTWAHDEPVPRRLAADSLKVVVGMGFLRRPEVLGAIGWRESCRGGTGPLLREFMDDEDLAQLGEGAL